MMFEINLFTGILMIAKMIENVEYLPNKCLFSFFITDNFDTFNHCKESVLRIQNKF